MARDLGLLVLLAGVVGCSSPGSGGSSIIDRGVCDALIACASELAPESRDEFIAVYGEGGSCWTGGPMQ
jgi:hypothetical protein